MSSDGDRSMWEPRGGEGSGFSDFERKRWSQDAKLKRCAECGSYEGRHLRVCSKWVRADMGDTPFQKGSGDAPG